MAWRKGQAYGQDLRDRVLQATGRVVDIAVRFGVSPAYVSRTRARCEQLGQTCAGAQRNHVPLRLAALKDDVLAQVAKAPEQTLVQLCAWVHTRHGIVVKPSTMHKSLVRFGLTFKKKRYTPASSNAPTSRSPAPAGPPSSRRWPNGD